MRQSFGVGAPSGTLRLRGCAASLGMAVEGDRCAPQLGAAWGRGGFFFSVGGDGFWRMQCLHWGDGNTLKGFVWGGNIESQNV